MFLRWDFGASGFLWLDVCAVFLLFGKDVVESRIGEAISDEEAEAAGGSDGRGDLVAALESRSGAEDQCQGVELRGD
ncbi:hypothetical protein SO802_025697 [Lithocarpus litseifolius]|uniref:Uncharacterized protein n=1 Tax=Lithocarpus litseifolius TaxID=425828 RepID=A0AAW2BZG3_9ROSI